MNLCKIINYQERMHGFPRIPSERSRLLSTLLLRITTKSYELFIISYPAWGTGVLEGLERGPRDGLVRRSFIHQWTWLHSDKFFCQDSKLSAVVQVSVCNLQTKFRAWAAHIHMKDWTSLWLAVRQLAGDKASQVPTVSYHDVVL